MITDGERKTAAITEASRLLRTGDLQKSPDSLTEKRIHDTVIGRIDREPHRKVPAPFFSRFSSSGRLNPSHALAAAALILVAFTAFKLLPGITGLSGEGTIEVHLSFHAPEAGEVVVVGDWNGWDPQSQILRDDDNDGVWEIRFRVEPEREYQYQFIVDGKEWLPDPDAWLHVPDGFGGTNSVLDLSNEAGVI